MAKNKHDLLFRKTFNNINMFKALCDAYLPRTLKSQIDFNKLKLHRLSGNFIRSQVILNHGPESLKNKNSYNSLKEEMADVVYSAELISGGHVLFILHAEHQSKPDKLYPLRTALYDISAVKDFVQHYKPKELPVPISILYYHGRPTPYPYTTDLMQMFANREMAKEYFLQPILIDLGRFSDTELNKHGEIGGFEIAYKHVYDKIVPTDKVVALVDALKNCSSVELRLAWYTYSIDVWETDPEAMIDIYKEAIPNDEGLVMTAAERLRQQGMQQGMQQGIKEGEVKKAREVAKLMLSNDQPIEMIAKYVQLPESELLQLKEALFA